MISDPRSCYSKSFLRRKDIVKAGVTTLDVIIITLALLPLKSLLDDLKVTLPLGYRLSSLDLYTHFALERRVFPTRWKYTGGCSVERSQ